MNFKFFFLLSVRLFPSEWSEPISKIPRALSLLRPAAKNNRVELAAARAPSLTYTDIVSKVKNEPYAQENERHPQIYYRHTATEKPMVK